MTHGMVRPKWTQALVLLALALAGPHQLALGEKPAAPDKTPDKKADKTLPLEDRHDLLNLVRRYNAAKDDAQGAEAVVRRAIEIGELGVKRLGPAVEKDYQEARRKYHELFTQEASTAREQFESVDDGEDDEEEQSSADVLSRFLQDHQPLAELRERALRVEKLMKLLIDAAGPDDKSAEKRAEFAALSVARFESATLQQFRDMSKLTEFDAEEAAVVTATNKERVEKGLPPLVLDKGLCLAAADHSADMEEHGFFDHESPIEGKTTPADRAENFDTTAAGENIAQARSGEAAVEMWMKSDGHRENILDPYYRRIGVGRSGKNFTQMFGR